MSHVDTHPSFATVFTSCHSTQIPRSRLVNLQAHNNMRTLYIFCSRFELFDQSKSSERFFDEPLENCFALQVQLIELVQASSSACLFGLPSLNTIVLKHIT